MDKNTINTSVKWGLNITDQEIGETLGINLSELMEDDDFGENTTFLGTICSGWWSNNWCQ